MGITGLLPLLNSITDTVHISSYRGMKVAIDAYVWLHKGAYPCSEEICRNLPTTKFLCFFSPLNDSHQLFRYIDFCLHRITLLQSFDITPIMVFDGGLLPAKRNEEKRRYRIREEYKNKAEAYVVENKQKQAKEAFQRAVDISPRIAQNVIERLKELSVEFIVAPYEADAQLAYLSYNGLVDVVITEDSDLLAYGCKKVFFKMDKMGNGKEVESKKLIHCRTPLSFEGFTLQMFRQMCIFSGCDYVNSPSGLGIRTAYQLMANFKTCEAVLSHLYSETSNYHLPVRYGERFHEAELTFLYQRVWDPESETIIHLHPLPPSLVAKDLDFLGEAISPEMGFKIACALVNPQTREPWGCGTGTPIQKKKSGDILKKKVPLLGKEENLLVPPLPKKRKFPFCQEQTKQKIPFTLGEDHPLRRNRGSLEKTRLSRQTNAERNAFLRFKRR